MRKTVTVLLIVGMLSSGVWAQTPAVAQKKSLNPKLGIVGMVTAFVGGLIMIPWPEGEDYTLDYQSYCVHQGDHFFNMDDGRCTTTEPKIKAGLVLLAAGGAMMGIGFYQVKVQVAPMVGRHVAGAKVMVKW